MTGWIILSVFGGLVLLIVILLLVSVKATVKIGDEVNVKAKYLFFTLYPKKEKSPKKQKKKELKKKKKELKKQKKSAKNKNKNKNKTKKQTAKNGEKNLTEQFKDNTGINRVADDIKKAKTDKKGFDFEVIKLTYDSLETPVRKLVQKMRIKKFRIKYVIGGEDAAKIALTYGMQAALISTSLAWADEIVSLKIKEVNLTADFDKEESEFEMSFIMKLRLNHIVMFLIRYIKNNVKNNKD